jgi:hypothetical protein
MTSLAVALAVDSRGPSALYIITDSRVSFDTDWDEALGSSAEDLRVAPYTGHIRLCWQCLNPSSHPGSDDGPSALGVNLPG